MSVPDEEKLQLLGSTMGLIMDTLGSHDPDGELSGDDVLDFFAIGVAAVIENDTNLTTPRHQRLAAEAASKRVERWVKALRAMHDDAGESFLALALKVPRTPPPLDS